METELSKYYPMSILHDGQRLTVKSPFEHSQVIGKPVNNDGTLVEDFPPPPTVEDQIAALYPEQPLDPLPLPQPVDPDGADEAQAVPVGNWKPPVRRK